VRKDLSPKKSFDGGIAHLKIKKLQYVRLHLHHLSTKVNTYIKKSSTSSNINRFNYTLREIRGKTYFLLSVCVISYVTEIFHMWRSDLFIFPVIIYRK